MGHGMTHSLPQHGFITRFFLRWASRRQLKELTGYVEGLRLLNDYEMAELLLLVGMLRIGMEKTGLTPLEPSNLILFQRPAASVEMARQSQAFKARGQVAQALACTAWWHTFRAALDGRLQPACRLMWKELGRGQKGLHVAAAAAKDRDGITVDANDAGKIPRWFA